MASQSIPRLAWQPFPVEALPEPLRRFSIEAASAIGCDPAFIIMPLLAIVAAAIGSTRTLLLKPGWFAPSILWTVVVAESGSAKTPAHRVATAAMLNRQRKALMQHAAECRQYEIELARYERDLAVWKRLKDSTEPPPEKPPEPAAERCLVSDTTVEALAPILERNLRGLLVACDELAGWFGSFGAYKSGRGGDLQNWLKLFDGSTLIVDRKTSAQGGPQTTCVPHAYCSVTGGVQPGVFRRALANQELRDSGFLARLLVVMPPRQAKRWTDQGLDPATANELAQLVERLYELRPNVDESGDPTPVVVRMTPEAKAAWVQHYNQHNGEQVELSGDLAASWSKLEQMPARLALVLHFVRWAAGDPELQSADKVDGDTMVAAIRLAGWLKHETRRVYEALDESDEAREQRELVEWLKLKGGSATVRELMRSKPRHFPTADDAEAAFALLVKAGLGKREPADSTPGGGRPSESFRLLPPVDSDRTQDSPRVAGVLSVSTRSESPAIGADDSEWGEV